MRAWAVSLCFLLALAAPARGEGDPYTAPPTTQGPLLGDPLGPNCVEDELWGPKSRDGRTGVCEWHFHLSPAAEPDAENDYSANWLQIDVDPPTGSCIREIDLTFDFDGAEVVSATRSGTTRYKAMRPVRETLEVDADGQGLSPASISTDTLVSAGRVRMHVTDTALRYSWRGSEAGLTSVVLGWQLRHPLSQPIYQILQKKGFLVASCRRR